MPITSSAKKALRQSIRKREMNLSRKEAIKFVLRKIIKLKAENKKDEAVKALPEYYKAIDKAAKRGVIKKNAAARKKSRLTKFLAK